jgi:SpoVK/Ycf46/Vps4 family AAA+-type ATPase
MFHRNTVPSMAQEPHGLIVDEVRVLDKAIMGNMILDDNAAGGEGGLNSSERRAVTIGVDVQAICRDAVFEAIRDTLSRDSVSPAAAATAATAANGAGGGEASFQFNSAVYSSLSADINVEKVFQRHFDTAVSNYFGKSYSAFELD